jgi:hypothetical protein
VDRTLGERTACRVLNALVDAGYEISKRHKLIGPTGLSGCARTGPTHGSHQGSDPGLGWMRVGAFTREQAIDVAHNASNDNWNSRGTCAGLVEALAASACSNSKSRGSPKTPSLGSSFTLTSTTTVPWRMPKAEKAKSPKRRQIKG